MEPFLSELPYHIYDWLIISLKDFCIVIRKWPTFLPSRMFPVHKRVDQLKMNHMFNIIQGISPAYLREDILLSDNSNHQTRSVTSPSCQIPRVNSSGLKSFFFTAIKCWNSLPSCVRNIDLKQPFKSMLKKTIWDQMFLENQQSFIYY